MNPVINQMIETQSTDLFRSFRQKYHYALESAGRKPEEVKIVAASKGQTIERIAGLVNSGVRSFGENYVQELLEKRELLRESDIEWHFIGHLQTNKTKYIASFVSLVHTIDSLSLATELSRQSEKSGRTIDFLFQVNTSGESSKSGVEPHLIRNLALKCRGLSFVRLCGLMCIPAPSEEPDAIKSEFALLRQLRDEIQNELGDPQFKELSMGMSDDFELAIEQGATIIRPGSALFGDRISKKIKRDGANGR